MAASCIPLVAKRTISSIHHHFWKKLKILTLCKIKNVQNISVLKIACTWIQFAANAGGVFVQLLEWNSIIRNFHINCNSKKGTTLSSGGYVRKTFSWILFFAVLYFLYFELDSVLEKVSAGESKVSKAQADDPFGYLVSKSSKVRMIQYSPSLP